MTAPDEVISRETLIRRVKQLTRGQKIAARLSSQKYSWVELRVMALFIVFRFGCMVETHEGCSSCDNHRDNPLHHTIIVTKE